MLEWTGERFLPWIKESTIAYEHLHRYAYAATLVKDKRVLDLACGEGYGAKMLAESAASVVGVDIDENAVLHAAAKYGSSAVVFLSASVTSVPIADAHSFDVIVCFEAIEHIEDQERLLTEVKRLLKDDGIFIVSTPNKTMYSDENTEENPFHVKELEFEEFRQLLARHFQDIRFFGQRVHPGSSIWPIGSENSNGFREFVIDRGESEFQLISNDKRVPLYFMAIASDSTASPPQPGSVLIDHSDGLFHEKNRELTWRSEQLTELIKSRDELTEARKWLEFKVGEHDETIKSQEQALKWRESQIELYESEIRLRESEIKLRESQIEELNQGLDWLRNLGAETEQTIRSHEQALAWRAQQVDSLEAETRSREAGLQNARLQLGMATEQLEGIQASSGWKFILGVRKLRNRLLPAGSARESVFNKVTGLGKPRS